MGTLSDRFASVRLLHLLGALILSFQVTAALADGVYIKHERLGPSSSANSSTKRLPQENQINTLPEGDSYSLAPTIQDDQFFYYMTDDQSDITLTFNQEWKELGNNQYGTSNGKFTVIEKIEGLDNGNIEISVQVTAVDSNYDPEPWVDEQHQGSGFVTWRLDIGTDAGGTNRIRPDQPFTVEASGVHIFNSAGDYLTTVEIDDTSTSAGLSGIALVGFTDGTDIAGNDMSTMIMFWEIKVESDDTGFKVTSGQSGSWYDPSHDGEGYVLQVFSESQAAVYWFSYDTAGNQYWMLGVGDIIGSRIIFDDLQTTRGGRFGPDFDPDDVERSHWGTLELNFSDCNNATASYQGPPEFGTGTLNVTRLSSLWGVDCAGHDTSPSVSGTGHLAAGFSGSWFDYAHDGEGFTLEILNESMAVIFWYTYDRNGNQAWLSMIGNIDGATIFAPDVYQPSGATFGPEFDPNDVVRADWGAAVFSFGSCAGSQFAHGGSMRYLPPAEFGVEGIQLLGRLLSIEGVDCSFLSGTYDVSVDMVVAENIFVDGDVNDPNVEETPNDLDSENAQQLVRPAKVAGYVTATPTGAPGDRFESDFDEFDVYLLAMEEGEGLTLTVSDWNPQNRMEVDLDLYLVDVNDTDNILASSLSTNEQELVYAPFSGNFFVIVKAESGQSNYLLQSGQVQGLSSNHLDVTTEFVPDQILAALNSPSSLQTVKGGSRLARIEEAERKYDLQRVSEDADGVVLYEINSKAIPSLQPHPLTVAGYGSITPDEWRVIRFAKELSNHPDFRWAGPNYLAQLQEIPNDKYYPYQWHYETIRLPEAWNIVRGSDDVVVAVLDSGVYAHPDLAANVDYALGYDFVSNIFQSEDGDGIDPDARDPGIRFQALANYVSHGTHVAGTIGSRTDNGLGVAGVNWNVTIMPVRVCGKACACSDVIQGLKWAGRLANNSGALPSRSADIINMSLSGFSPCPGSQEVINQLASRGAITIASAGNDGNSIPNYPASLNHVVSVSATTIKDKLAPYSSYGSNVDIAAPGGDMNTDVNEDSYPDGVLSAFMYVEKGSTEEQVDFWFLNGTSMAAPHVAGVAALMKSVYPDLGPSDFDTGIASGNITLDLAQNGPTVKDQHFGYGRIDAYKAVQWALAAEQGEPTNAFLTSSAAALDFSSNLTSIELQIEKAGEGDISVSGIGWGEEWVSVYSVDVDANNLGRYRIEVDRAGLLEGQYSDWIAIDASDGSRLWVSAFMRVGANVSGEAGFVYALILDQWAFGNVKQWAGAQGNNEFAILLQDLPPSTYFLMVSTDLDNDGQVCDDGELCELYPSSSSVNPIVLQKEDLDLGTFRMGFPVPFLKSSGGGSSAVMNAFQHAGAENSLESRIILRRAE